MMELEALVMRLREAGAAARTGEPMARHTTLRLGGPAEVFCRDVLCRACKSRCFAVQ